MNRGIFSSSVLFILATLVGGCASYRTSSNVDYIPSTPTSASTEIQTKQVLLSQTGFPDRRVKELGPIEVTVKKLTVFHKDPTQEQANEALVERARALDADAVVNITYKSGIGLTTWGYVEAKGVAVKFLPDRVATGTEASIATEPANTFPTWSADAKRAYDIYLGRNDPRSFVMDQNGRFFWLSGHQWDGRPPSAHALEKCIQAGGQGCRVVDIDGHLRQ